MKRLVALCALVALFTSGCAGITVRATFTYPAPAAPIAK